MQAFLQQLLNSMVLGGAYVLVALGLFMVFSTLHIPNFAHGEMFAVGGYLQYTFVVGLSMGFLSATLLVILSTAVLGAFLWVTVFRRLQRVSVMAVLLGSIAVAIIMQELIALIWGRDQLGVPTPISGVVDLSGLRIAEYRLFIIGTVVVVSLAMGALVYRTLFGRQLRALAQNAEIANLSGIDSRFVAIVTFVLGSSLAGFAGALLAPTLVLDPHMGFSFTLVAFTILVLVGSGGRMAAVVFTGFALATLETLTAGYVSNSLRTAAVFSVLIVFLIVRPEGAVRSASSIKVRL